MLVLKDYQAKILSDLKKYKSIGIFSKTGSGKTFMALKRFEQNPTPNLLVICPPVVVEQWQKEVKKILPHMKVPTYKRAQSWEKRLESHKDTIINPSEPVAVVVSLNSVYKNKAFLRAMLNDSWTIILDESHRIKDMGTTRSPVKTTVACLELGKQTSWKIILTATPTEGVNGGFINLYSQLKFLGYLSKYDLNSFKRRYCIEEQVQVYGLAFPIKKIVGYTPHVKEIVLLLKEISRSYSPQYTEEAAEHFKILLDKPKNYAKFSRERFYVGLNATFDTPTALRIGKKTLCSGILHGADEFGDHASIKDNDIKADWLVTYLTENPDVVPVVFYQFNVQLDALKEACKRAGRVPLVLNGSVNNKKELIEKGGYNIILGQLDACSESLDGLQFVTNVCIYYTMPDSSLVYRQSLGRIDRIGQTIAPLYYYLVCEKTIDEDVYNLIEQKVEFSQETIDAIAVKGA